MVAQKRNGSGKRKQPPFRTAAHGDYRSRRVLIGRRALLQIDAYRKYYNMVRHEILHKIIGDWAKRYLPDNEAEFVDYELSQPDEFFGLMVTMYDNDYEILESFSSTYYGNHKAASSFAKMADWWIAENKSKFSQMMGTRKKKGLKQDGREDSSPG